MSANIFEIENLSCEYAPGLPVLVIPHLYIPRGEMIFVVGASGIGKSTFIETLGLMNNTIARDKKTSIRYPGGSGISELTELWTGPASTAADFRKKHFSFIFQQTNLMPNFTAGENVAIGMLLQNRTMAEIKPGIMALMEQFNLPGDIFDRKVYELSGGQKQRLAFLRAVTSGFEVMFGDEPTGNLDSETARLLMHFLTDLLKKEHKTALIVSHDLSLSLEFGDRILVITPQRDTEKQSGRLYGLLSADNQLVRDSGGKWHNKQQQIVNDPHEWLRMKIDFSAS